jgi:hypothetical protein
MGRTKVLLIKTGFRLYKTFVNRRVSYREYTFTSARYYPAATNGTVFPPPSNRISNQVFL